jgi:hypothetical protein
MVEDAVEPFLTPCILSFCDAIREIRAGQGPDPFQPLPPTTSSELSNLAGSRHSVMQSSICDWDAHQPMQFQLARPPVGGGGELKDTHANAAPPPPPTYISLAAHVSP